MHLDPIYQRFRDTVIEHLQRDPAFHTRSGGVNLALFARRLEPRVHYESLRQALTSERVPSRELMEVVAEALPDVMGADIFPEYRALKIREELDPARNDYSSDEGFETFIAALRRYENL